MMSAGVPVTQDTLLEASAVYGCCRMIVDSLAPAPINVMQIKADGVRDSLPDDPTGYVLNWGAPVTLAGDALPAQAVEEALFWSALTGDGNGYAEIQRDGAGRVVALWPIEPGRVTPKRDGAAFFYEVSQPTGGTVRVSPLNMFHLRGPSVYGWAGDSTVYRASKAIGLALAGQTFASAMLANGAVPSGILTSDKIVTADQAKRAKEQWNETNGGGPGRAHQIAVVGQGIKYQSVSSNAQEAQLLESRRFQVTEIARFFGVPTTLLAENEAWTNLSELYLGFYRNALKPWAERFDAEATRKLFPNKAPWREVQHDLTALTLGSFKDQVAAVDQAVAGGLWTRNEGRAVFGKNSIPGGDVMVVSSSVKPLADALKPPPPPPVFGSPAPEEPDADDDEGEEEPPAKMPMRPPASNVARVAIALDRFERAMVARRKAIEKDAPDKAEANLAAHRARLVPGVVAECAPLLTNATDSLMRVEAAADAVLAGEPAHLAAERLCT